MPAHAPHGRRNGGHHLHRIAGSEGIHDRRLILIESGGLGHQLARVDVQTCGGLDELLDSPPPQAFFEIRHVRLRDAHHVGKLNLRDAARTPDLDDSPADRLADR